jgi:hypothetical protein
MSTLTVQTISNGTVSTSSENVIRGSARAWVNFVGSATPTIRSSYNVTSITYTATALFTVNFPAGVFADNNYSVVGMAQRDSNNICVVCILGSASYNSLSTTAAQLTTLENTNQRVTAQTVCAAFYR